LTPACGAAAVFCLLQPVIIAVIEMTMASAIIGIDLVRSRRIAKKVLRAADGRGKFARNG
jgi:hypothetical protein